MDDIPNNESFFKNLQLKGNSVYSSIQQSIILQKKEIKMSYIAEIFERSTLNEITSFLLTGAGAMPREDGNTDYQIRLKNAYQRCEDILSTYDNDKDSILYTAINQLVSENEQVYMEIGFQAGILLAYDMWSNLHNDISSASNK